MILKGYDSVVSNSICTSAELISGENAHPETADVLLMPTIDVIFNQVARNDELNTETRVSAGLESNETDKEYWLIGYLSSDKGNLEEVEQFELARVNLCDKDKDPNGYYATQICKLLITKATEGHLASEITDYLNGLVAQAQQYLEKSIFTSIS
ncbi:hypothetical protein KA111_00575 [Candidatus Woesebacteria bacterium]|nr:hypothetical protein [Candidatus Woesebacteria bacterium]